jgi:hypothetical protein
MADYRDPYRNPNDPIEPPPLGSDMDRSNTGVGWIAGSVFLIVVLALIFGLGRTGERTAQTGPTPPAATTTTGAAPPAPATPAPVPPAPKQ